MQVKDYEIVEEGEDETLHAGRLVPVYGLTQGLTQRPMRSLMKRLVDAYADQVEEPLPDPVRARRRLGPLAAALKAGHFSQTEAEQAAARRRLAYDDFFLLQLGLAIRRHREGRQRGVAMNPPGAFWQKLLGSLPYTLTNAQQRVWREIRTDMAAPYPMNRLLQGDVGSGKTVVATLAILAAIEAGYQAGLMAPTEILAEQHFMTLTELLGPLDVPVALLTNNVKGKARESVLSRVAGGEIGCVVGTHALVQEGVQFRRLGLAVVDEQHRFGVAQRATLRGKGESPDVLVMTATPIPRTLALTLYGDLDVSVLDELPPGRRPVITRARPESGRRKIYAFLRAGRGGPPGVRGLPARGGVRGLRSARGHRDGGAAAAGGVPRPARGPAARPHGLRGQGAGDAGVQERGDSHPRLDHRDRGRDRCAQRRGDGGRACRAVRPLAAPSASRTRRPRPVEELLHPPERRLVGGGQAPHRRHGGDQ